MTPRRLVLTGWVVGWLGWVRVPLALADRQSVDGRAVRLCEAGARVVDGSHTPGGGREVVSLDAEGGRAGLVAGDAGPPRATRARRQRATASSE